MGTVDARLHSLLQDCRRPLGPEVLRELLHLPPLQVRSCIGLLVDVEADCGNRPTKPSVSKHIRPGVAPVCGAGGGAERGRSRMPQPCPLGSGLGEAEKAKVAPILPNLTSKRDKRVNHLQLPGLALKTVSWLGRDRQEYRLRCIQI